MNAGRGEVRAQSVDVGVEELEERLLREEFRYQKITLPSGRSVGVRDRSATAAAIFPPDLTGKSVLDLGCNYGYFCFEAKRRGAARVVGLDVDADALRKARLLAQCLGLEVEFQLRDIEAEPLAESFDYILCLNLLHHLNDPLTLLRHMADRARERLVLEVATLGPHDGRKLRLFPLMRRLLLRYPVIYVAPAAAEAQRKLKNYYLTPKALENLLLMQRRLFASLEIRPSEFKGRFLALAHRRRIRHLLLVAGPTAAGKRTLAAALFGGALPELAAALELGDPARFGRLVRDAELRRPGPAAVDALALRYDILRPHFASIHGYARDPVLDVLACAERVTILTIFAPPERLAAQLRAAEAGKRRWSKRHRRMLERYESGKVLEDYRRWLAFSERFAGAERWVVAPYEGHALHPADAFRRRLAEAGGG